MSRKSSALFEKISPLSKNTKNPASTNTRDLIVREEKLHWTRRRSYKAYGTFGVSRREGERVQKYKEATRKTLAVARETSGNICPRFFSTSSRRYSAVRTLSTLDIPPAGVVAFLDFRVCLSLASALTSSCHALVTATSLLYPRLPPRCHSHSAYVCGTRVTQACEDARARARFTDDTHTRIPDAFDRALSRPPVPTQFFQTHCVSKTHLKTRPSHRIDVRSIIEV